MKTLSLLLIFMVVGCAGMELKQPENPICPQDDSWICFESEELGIAPETAYGWIYSAAAMSTLSDLASIQGVCEFEAKIAAWYKRLYPISYNSLIDQVLIEARFMDSPEKVLLIKNIVNKNLELYRSAELISEVDDMILRRGHFAFRRDMLCNAFE